MIKTKKSRIFLLISVLILLNVLAITALFTVHLSGGKNIFESLIPAKTHSIVLTKDGFIPEKLTIHIGDTVVFSTTADKQFWPASNLHPTHDIYPAFDPQIPIEPDKTWAFTFNKEGNWKFHDHMSPIFRGEIIVLGRNAGSQNSELSNITCTNIPDSMKRTQCIDAFFSKTLEKEGVSGAFDLMDTLFQEEPNFSASCHDFAHRLGQKAYTVFAKNKEVALSEKSSYCGYGFYHGFMEALVYNTGDIQEASDFCDYAEKSLSEKSADSGGACYHGIGHGIVEDTPDPDAWGDAQKIINPGLALCAKVSLTKDKKFRCDTGVFNALEILMTQNKYQLSLNTVNPYWICDVQKEEHKEACYTQMVVAVLHVTHDDFAKSAAIIDTIQNDTYAISAMYTLAIELVHTKKNDYQGALNFCRSLSDRFQRTCITSYAEGFMKYGPPQKEYVDAVQFCNSPLLTEDDKKACFGRVLAVLRIWYTAQRSAEICQSVDPRFQYNECRYN
jgi:hypothetical protein